MSAVATPYTLYILQTAGVVSIADSLNVGCGYPLYIIYPADGRCSQHCRLTECELAVATPSQHCRLTECESAVATPSQHCRLTECELAVATTSQHCRLTECESAVATPYTLYILQTAGVDSIADSLNVSWLWLPLVSIADSLNVSRLWLPPIHYISCRRLV